MDSSRRKSTLGLLGLAAITIAMIVLDYFLRAHR